jgi:hypothetical protein
VADGRGFAASGIKGGSVYLELANRGSNRFVWRLIFPAIFCCLIFGGCHSSQIVSEPSIKFTKIPPSQEGGADKIDTIEGSVSGAKPGQQIVLYAKSGIWWVQPFAAKPFTAIQTDSVWKTSTHFGTEYAALLVEADYQPPPKLDKLPNPGDGIVSVEIIKGAPPAPSDSAKTINFSGYEWKIRTNTSDRGATLNYFSAANVRVDETGFLHLRIAREDDKWTCAEISLTRSLGFGTYNFVVRDVSQLNPSAVFSMFTWDDSEAAPNHREMDIEVSQWGDPVNKNLQFVVQPYYVPANVARFSAPAGALTNSFYWQAGRVTFKTTAAKNSADKEQIIAEHGFTSGIPSPENETVHLNLYAFGYGKNPLEKETEVVIEKFEFLP